MFWTIKYIFILVQNNLLNNYSKTENNDCIYLHKQLHLLADSKQLKPYILYMYNIYFSRFK